MGFDKGNCTFRVCALPEPLPKDVLERFADHAAAGLDQVSDEPTWGWVSGRFLLENTINEETCKCGPYIHICLRQTERKIPGALLTAECRLEELSRMKAEGTDHLSAKVRKAIKNEVKERLLPTMPPTITGIYAAIDPVANLLYTTALSAKQFDIFSGHFAQAVGFDPIPLTPDNLTLTRYELDPMQVPAVNISPELDDVTGAAGGLGENFLTWLWYFQESHEGNLPHSKLGDFSLMVDGPLTFASENSGAFESTLRKGTPTIAAEARAAMMVGKKLRSAKLILARAKGEEWSCTLDAAQMVVRGLKLPEGDSFDPVDVFIERMVNLDIFRQVLFELFHLYLKVITDPVKAAEYQEQAKQWVREHEQK